MYCAYVLRNPNGKLYKGFTKDLERRLQQHNTVDGFHSFTHRKGPWELVYKEEYENELEARKREIFFKTGKGREFLKKKLGAVSA